MMVSKPQSRLVGVVSLVLSCGLFCVLVSVPLGSRWPSGNKRHTRRTDTLDRPWCQTRGLNNESEFWDYFKTLDYHCHDLRGYGGKRGMDGLKKACYDPPIAVRTVNCTVLSFGINNEWDFEDDIAATGCKVYAFDPTMRQHDHQRSEDVYFYQLGIGEVSGVRKIGMDSDIDYFKVDRYENILDRLGLKHAIIDYLKMDVELSELEFLRDVLRNSPHLLRNVRQIGMEVHHGRKGEGVLGEEPIAGPLSPTSTFPLFWQHFQELRCLGFQRTHIRRNFSWHEVLWVQRP